jgi:pimeloyl-ACP methyl ester carboxylesterase
METWRTWELVLPALERQHDVLAITLPGHAGGPQLDGRPTSQAMVDAVERELDGAGFESAHLVGNSLGGWVAFQLAARGRATTVVALAPAGGWAQGDRSYRGLLKAQRTLHEAMQTAAPQADAILSTREGRRRVTRQLTTNFEHLPVELLASLMLGVASCGAAVPLIERGLRERWSIDAERIACPVRIIWGTADQLLPWPQAAARYRDCLPSSEWVLLEGIGHSPQLDVPLEAAQLILDFTA